ncbi:MULTISPECIES: OsmC family peroxiredoxin [Haematobacter]|uniref:OsmC family peroxiredoxin n=1 Tax=Haematobacter TaxID=366614 RepID=UPI0015C66C9E|nr:MULTISPECIES: OsmC family peroxiredoxin [Haematobacter]
MIEKYGTAVWNGSLKEGHGSLSTQSNALTDKSYSYATRFEKSGGSNPEELLGAAHAGCFSMALASILGKKGITPHEIDTTSKITLDPSQGAITKAHLVVVIRADADEETLVAAAKEAETGCPVSKLFKAEISMEARKG